VSEQARPEVPGDRHPGDRRRDPHPLLELAAAAVVVALDQVTKIAVRGGMQVGQSRPLVPGVLYLTYVHNTGAAFGLMPDRQMIFIVTSLALSALFLWLLLSGRLTGALSRGAVALVLGGSIGNLIDRLVVGRVTDFLDVRFWPVFNVADSAIVVGACLLALAAFVLPKSSGETAATTETG
jgi:signal peptidase II